MTKDFEDMVKAWDQAKKELQAWFDECHRLLDEDWKFAEEQASIMWSFKTDYTDDLISLTTLLEWMIREETEFTVKELDVADNRI